MVCIYCTRDVPYLVFDFAHVPSVAMCESCLRDAAPDPKAEDT